MICGFEASAGVRWRQVSDRNSGLSTGTSGYSEAGWELSTGVFHIAPELITTTTKYFSYRGRKRHTEKDVVCEMDALWKSVCRVGRKSAMMFHRG